MSKPLFVGSYLQVLAKENGTKNASNDKQFFFCVKVT